MNHPPTPARSNATAVPFPARMRSASVRDTYRNATGLEALYGALVDDRLGDNDRPITGSTVKHRLLITGSRAWTDEQMIRDAIAANVRRHGPDDLVIVHGACPSGADALTDRIAAAWGGGLTVERHPADWDHCILTCHPDHRRQKPPGDIDHPGLLSTYCPGAGPRRNAHMVKLGADLCLAFLVAGSRGATHAANLAEHAGILTHRFEA